MTQEQFDEIGLYLGNGDFIPKDKLEEQRAFEQMVFQCRAGADWGIRKAIIEEDPKEIPEKCLTLWQKIFIKLTHLL